MWSRRCRCCWSTAPTQLHAIWTGRRYCTCWRSGRSARSRSGLASARRPRPRRQAAPTAAPGTAGRDCRRSSPSRGCFRCCRSCRWPLTPRRPRRATRRCTSPLLAAASPWPFTWLGWARLSAYPTRTALRRSTRCSRAGTRTSPSPSCCSRGWRDPPPGCPTGSSRRASCASCPSSWLSRSATWATSPSSLWRAPSPTTCASTTAVTADGVCAPHAHPAARPSPSLDRPPRSASACSARSSLSAPSPPAMEPTREAPVPARASLTGGRGSWRPRDDSLAFTPPLYSLN
mmetsp:Transcript_33938/g.108221  ORF Transcript_33938/g.108221 Transcript_33938/m.108221 type:complete len:289 (+) Transcript_33938:2493-3359(+)